MELRQLRYFVKAAECGNLGHAATELGMVISALSQQISHLESELCTRLLTRTSTGVLLTDTGLAFLRHADDAVKAARITPERPCERGPGVDHRLGAGPALHARHARALPRRATAASGKSVGPPFHYAQHAPAGPGHDELSPTALAVRVLLAQTASGLVRLNTWPGATLHK